MPTINFPSNPQLNDTYTFGTKTWTWNGSAWALQASGAINDIPIGNVTPSTGSFTTATVSGNVIAGGIRTDNYYYANGDPFLTTNDTAFMSNVAPSSPTAGDLWIDTDSGRQYTYINDGDSSQWVELATPSSEIGTDKTSLAIFNFPTAINANLTIESGYNGLSVGPVTQAANTVIHINAGQRWIIL